MNDYTYPSVYFSYFLFALLVGGALYFFIRSLKEGYWGADSEAPKYRMLEDDEEQDAPLSHRLETVRRSS